MRTILAVLAVTAFLAACSDRTTDPVGVQIDPVLSVASSLPVPVGSETEVTLFSAGDTYLKRGTPNKNQGTLPELRVRSSGHNRVLLAFDQAQIDERLSDGFIEAVRLRLQITFNANNWGTEGRAIDLHRLTQPWNELGATWNCAVDADLTNQRPDCDGITEWEMGKPNQPELHPWEGTATASTVIEKHQVGTVTLDVTSDVLGFLDGSFPNHGWILMKREEGKPGRVEFESRDSGDGPTLVASGFFGTRWNGLTAGTHRSCGITMAGDGFCWGSPTVGDGSTTHADTPALIAGGLSFSQIDAAGHTCGIASGPAAYCWGDNLRGRIGDGTLNRGPRLTPHPVVGGQSFVTVAGPHHDHACAVTATGNAYCWGGNWIGQLGRHPVNLDWNPNPSQVNVPESLVGDVGVGNGHSCALAQSGAIYCWGDNRHGQLGSGSSATSRVSPDVVVSSETFVDLAVGLDHTCGLNASGQAFCWGNNENGQLGDGSTAERRLPVAVATSVTFVSITAGRRHTCGVTDDGIGLCWGANANGELGDGGVADQSLPTAVAGGHEFSEIDAGHTHTCGVSVEGTALCWGNSFLGALGDGSGSSSVEPVRVADPYGS